MKRIWLLSALLAGSLNLHAQEQCATVKDGILRLACYLDNANIRRHPDAQRCPSLKAEVVQLACFDKANGVFQLPKDSSEANKCAAIVDRAERLNCFDVAFLDQEPSKENGTKSIDGTQAQGGGGEWLVQVREQGLPKSLTVADPATVGFKHENQRDDLLLKASVVALGPAFSNSGSGWYPFLSFDVNQDLSAPKTKRANTKTLGAGVSGTIFDYASLGYALDSTFKVASKKDSEAHTESIQTIFDNAVVLKRLVIGAPWNPAATSFQLIPKFGGSYEDLRKVKSPQPIGHYTSLYTGAALTVWPSFHHRVQLNALAQRFLDTNASGGLEKRYANFYSFGVDFYLFDPTKEVPFTPIIGLFREIGTNPLNGTLDANKTVLTLRFKFN
jgi:hypothetical protein